MRRVLVFKIIAVCLGLVVSLVLAEFFLRIQDFIQLDGFAERERWHPVLHHGSGDFVEGTYGQDCQGEPVRVLLLGDSWMEDPVLSGTIGRELARRTEECIRTVNGGNSSYAPTVYLLRARQAAHRYGQFDLVIVNIDSTDVGDEWLRYRIPLKRDEAGSIVAVPFRQDIRSLFIRNGKLWAEGSQLYLIRFVRFALFYNVLVPYLEQFTVAPNQYDSLMKYVFATESEQLYAEEKNYFYARLVEMVAEMNAATSGPQSVYVAHHPHWRGLGYSPLEGPVYTPFVSRAIARLAREERINELDARPHVEAIHGPNLSVDTYEKNDPFSHLASAGARRYGTWIAEQVAPKVRTLRERQ